MANGLTPALQSGDDDKIRVELSTVLLALRRLRADLASGRVLGDRRLLSLEEIDTLLASLNTCRPSPMIRAQRPAATPKRFHREDQATLNERSTSSWNALERAAS